MNTLAAPANTDGNAHAENVYQFSQERAEIAATALREEYAGSLADGLGKKDDVLRELAELIADDQQAIFHLLQLVADDQSDAGFQLDQMRIAYADRAEAWALENASRSVIEDAVSAKLTDQQLLDADIYLSEFTKSLRTPK